MTTPEDAHLVSWAKITAEMSKDLLARITSAVWRPAEHNANFMGLFLFIVAISLIVAAPKSGFIFDLFDPRALPSSQAACYSPACRSCRISDFVWDLRS